MSTIRKAVEPRATEVATRGKSENVLTQKALDWDVEIRGRLARVCTLKDEWYQQLQDPERLVAWVCEGNCPADIFSFIQMPPAKGLEFQWMREMDNVAAIELTSYEQWWKRQIKSKTRALVRKSAKCGIEVRVVPFTDQLIHDIKLIYDETPIRQGKPFWHYRKDFDYLKALHATYLDRSKFIAAYFNQELVGFIKLVYSGQTANTMHIIAKQCHRDKAVSNGLVAKAVEVACEDESRYLVYDKFDYGTGGSPTLQRFKRNNGFERMEYPRFYIPLSLKGKFALNFGLHKGIVAALPPRVVGFLRDMRSRWHEFATRK